MSNSEYDREVEKDNFRRKFGRPYSKGFNTWTEELKDKDVEYFFTTEDGKEYCATADIYATINCYSNGDNDPQYEEGGGALESIGYTNIEFTDEEGYETQYTFTEKEEKDFKDFIYEYLNVSNYVD